MLKSIPVRILTHEAVLKAVGSSGDWGEQTYTEIALSRVHVQPVHSIVKSSEDKEIQLNSVLFYDCQESTPVVDWSALLRSSAENNAQMKVVYNGVEYTVFSVDLLPDDEGKLHHVEVLLY